VGDTVPSVAVCDSASGCVSQRVRAAVCDNVVRQCAAVWQCTIVCGSARSSVRQCAWQCAAVLAAVCGSASESVRQCKRQCAAVCVAVCVYLCSSITFVLKHIALNLR
jgi:hypothetical protein